MFLFFPLAHCYFLSCYFFSYLPTVSFSLLVLSYCYPDWINGTITYFPNTCILTCPLLLSFLLLFFLLAHCFFFPVTLFILLPKWTVTFFPVTFFPTCPLLLSFLLLLFLLLFFLPETVTFFPVTFFPVTFFPCTLRNNIQWNLNYTSLLSWKLTCVYEIFWSVKWKCLHRAGLTECSPFNA